MDTHALGNAANRTKPTGEKKIAPPSVRATDFLKNYMSQISNAIGRAIPPEQFAQSVINVIANDPNLIRAVSETPASLIGAILQSAQLGFVPNTPLGHGYIVPYYQKNKVKSQEQGREVKEMRVAFQLGYQGTLSLAYRSGDIGYVSAEAVYEKDFFDYQLGTDPYIKHKPYEGDDQGEIMKYYAVIKLKNGGTLFKVWRADKVMQHAKKFSKSYDRSSGRFFGPWRDNFESMAKKTVLIDCLHYAPKSVALAVGLASDNTTKSLSLNGDVIDVDVLMQKNEDFNEDEPGQAAIEQDESNLLDNKISGGTRQETIGAIRDKFGLGSGSALKKPAKEKKVGEMDPEDVL